MLANIAQKLGLSAMGKRPAEEQQAWEEDELGEADCVVGDSEVRGQR